MNKLLLAASFVLFNAFALSLPALAQAAPPVNANLKKAATLIPIPGIKDAVNDLFGSLKEFKSGEYAATTTVDVPGVGKLPLQLYVFGTSHQQAIVVIVNGTITMPKVFNNSAWKRMAGTTVTDPIFSLSTVDFSLDTNDMPNDYKQTIAKSYFNVASLEFSSGLQVAFKAHIGGVMKTVIEKGLGVPVQAFTLRAGAKLPMPTDANGSASLALAIAADMEHAADTFKDLAEFYVEYQLEPGKTITGPIGMMSITLTDVTISMNNKGVVGYKGNMVIPGGKKFITFFSSTINPAGFLDMADYQFGMATDTVTLTDVVNLMLAQQTAATPGGYIITHIPKFKAALDAATKPLSVIQLRNPIPLLEYKFGDKTKPFPPLRSFNFLEFGPLASVDDLTGKTIQGPYLKVVGDAVMLGQKVGSMNVVMGINGLHARAKAGMNLKLGPLGRQGIAMAIDTDVNLDKQMVFMHGNVLGRILDVTLNGSKLSIISPATCATPFELTAQLEITPGMNLASVLDGMPGANVDPAQITGCVGAELEKAYKWVASTGKNLGGYAASAANAELTKIGNVATEAAYIEYERVKDQARDKANKTANDAMKAFNDAGNAFKKFGKKKKRHKAPPDPRMEATVFDWDFYYDNQPDVAKSGDDLAQHWRDHGISEGRRGSPEFDVKFYMARYIDVKQACGSDRLCALNHWLRDGVDEGRQGSADVAVASYLNRYPELQEKFGKDNYPEALEHWMNEGSKGYFPEAVKKMMKGFGNGNFTLPDKHLYLAGPDIVTTGPIFGPKQIGSDDGGRWNDYDVCAGEYVTGFLVHYRAGVYGIQFHYNGRGWADVHGSMKKLPMGLSEKTKVMLETGEYIVRVDYRSGSNVDSVSFISNLGKTYGPYGGGGGGPGTYKVTPGEKLGCMAGRSNGIDSITKLLFSSTGAR